MKKYFTYIIWQPYPHSCSNQSFGQPENYCEGKLASSYVRAKIASWTFSLYQAEVARDVEEHISKVRERRGQIWKATYNATACEHDNEAANCSGSTHNPRQTDEQNDAEYILNARQVHANQCTHPSSPSLGLRIWVSRAGYRRRVIGNRTEKRSCSWSGIDFFLHKHKSEIWYKLAGNFSIIFDAK